MGKGRKSTSRKKISPKEQKHSFVRWFHHPIIQVLHHLARQPSSITPLRLTRPLEGAARNGTSSESTQPPQFQILGYCLWRDIKTNQQMILCCEFFMFRQQDISPNNHSCQNYSWKPVFVLLQDFGRRQLWGFLDEGKIGKPQNFVE